MNQTVSLNNVHAILVSTTDEVLMNAARYHARVIKSRASPTSDPAPLIDSIVDFSIILAHVIDTKGFPFVIPDPFAHPETVGLAWDAYRIENPALWTHFLTAIKMPSMIAEQIQGKLQEATAEMDAVSAHHVSPFKRQPTDKRRSR